jgi:hypothetical protein
VKYIFLLRTDPSIAPADDSPEVEVEMAEWGALYGELEEAGVLLQGMGLDTESTATTLRIRDGERILTDGPFAETKELLFSFFVLDVADLDAALAWAEKMPARRYGSVEVRPLSPHEQQQS